MHMVFKFIPVIRLQISCYFTTNSDILKNENRGQPTFESSFCFTYAPFAAVKTSLTRIKIYPSRSNAKSELGERGKKERKK